MIFFGLIYWKPLAVKHKHMAADKESLVEPSFH